MTYVASNTASVKLGCCEIEYGHDILLGN